MIKTLCFILFCASVALAQEVQFQYGSTDELRGITKIYVYTGPSLDTRNNIVKEIKKRLKDIVVTDRPEDAEIHLVFEASARSFYAGTYSTSDSNASATVTGPGTATGKATTNTTSTPIYRIAIDGYGFVGKRIGSDTVRLLMDFQDTKSTRWERRPSTNFARAFCKAYEKANK